MKESHGGWVEDNKDVTEERDHMMWYENGR